jgi:hypothetical protein
MLLTLDETTLFYHYRRTLATNKKLSGVIKNWAKAIEPTAGSNLSKTGSSASSARTVQTTSSSSTNQQTSTTKAATPVISDRIEIAAAEDQDQDVEQPEQHENDVFKLGGFAGDEAELDGVEGGFAMSSPAKGRKCVTNDVSSLLYLHHFH